MARETFSIAIGGKGVEPETLPLLQFAEYVKHLQDALTAVALSRSIAIDGEPKIALGFVDKGASVRAGLVIPHVLMIAVGVIAAALARGTPEDLPADAHNALSAVSKALARHEHSLSFLENLQAGIAPVTISAERPVRQRKVAMIREFTTLYGYLVHVGGEKEPTARIVIPQEKRQIRATLSQDTARALGARIYTDVGVEGWAKLDPSNGRVLELSIERVLSYAKSSASEAFSDLARAAGGAWDGVDSEAFLREIRGDDEEAGA